VEAESQQHDENRGGCRRRQISVASDNLVATISLEEAMMHVKVIVLIGSENQE